MTNTACGYIITDRPHKRITGAARESVLYRLARRHIAGEPIAALVAHCPYGIGWGEVEMAVAAVRKAKEG